MKKYHYAIKAINDEMLRCVGKVATKAHDRNLNPLLALQETKVMHLKEAIKILENHIDNKHV